MMAVSWAQSKVDRFEEKITGSNLGPGDYDPCLPRSQGMAGAVSLGFTSTKGMTLDREQNNPVTTEEVLSLPAPTSKQPTTTCGFGRPRPALNVGASRLEKVKAEQQEKQLVRLEMEREKLQDEVKTLRSLQGALAKSERHARAESAKVVKRAQAAERKAATVIADAGRLEEAEATASRLAAEVTAAALEAERTEADRDDLQQRKEELASHAKDLEDRIDELVKAKAEIEFQASEAQKREEALLRDKDGLRAANDASEARLREAKAASEASFAAAEEAARRAESAGVELAAARERAGELTALSARLEAELVGRGEELRESEDGNAALRREAAALRGEGEALAARAQGLEAELAGARRGLEGAAQEAEAKAAELSEAEAKPGGGAVRQKLESTKEILAEAEGAGASLEERLEASERVAQRLARELGGAEKGLESARESVACLKGAVTQGAADAESLRQRLGDALAEGVEYADQHTRAEERLRSSEADCAALWEEREEAKARLCAAFVEGRALEEKLDESVAGSERLREELGRAEARLAAAAREAEEAGDELSASRREAAAMKEELEKMTNMFATASSEARVLKASGADVNAEVSRLRAELEGKESRLAECAAREKGLSEYLASSEGLRGEAKAELAAAQKALNTGAEDFVALERRLCEAEMTCERLRSGVEATELEMSEQLAASEVVAAALGESLAEAAEGRGAAAARADRLQSEADGVARECAALREEGRAAAARCEEAEAVREGLERTVGELGSEVEGLRAAVVEKEACLEKASVAADRHRAEATRREAEFVGLRRVLEDVEAGHSAKNGEGSKLGRGSAGTHGIGAALGEKLISVVEEKRDVQGKLEAAEGALSSSEADRERLKLEVEANESAVEGLRGEIDESRLECEALQKAKCAMSKLEEASAEMTELKASCEGMYRAQTEGSNALREAGLANRNVQRLASENAALVGHNNNKQKIKHLQNLKKESIRLQNEKARQASDLALAIAVLEAVGVLPKEAGTTSTAVVAKRRGRGLHSRRSSGANSLSPARFKRLEAHGGLGGDGGEGGTQRGRSRVATTTAATTHGRKATVG
ncbi:hypothetical protein Esi_0046_0128 [Ectocarpus siliculosus]|uniref:Hyaluronan-mediated motility receptor C-terminal domain-containing protein n=1 Tax=Ectocarpus siliculosus TaxID=2880 RepID=D7G205_ECTSI|nr:hypothetical protein Esi_0046_0128 [Ectocarpus siliculosus]|eukprot:CBJ48731.1 hypothetical protein Esi_0046_0128 [Ectocarpus siliculosus]